MNVRTLIGPAGADHSGPGGTSEKAGVQVKTVTFYADRNRSGNLLHVETDGCIVNIHVGLRDSFGNRVTRVNVIPDDEYRGGDGNGSIWHVVNNQHTVLVHDVTIHNDRGEEKS